MTVYKAIRVRKHHHHPLSFKLLLIEATYPVVAFTFTFFRNVLCVQVGSLFPHFILI
jgi:hypothetical protein